MNADTKQNRPASDAVLPDPWRRVPLSSVAEIRFSNVDKKTNPGELPVRLCNYMEVYTNDYIVSGMPFMHASATKSEIERFAIRQGDVIITKDSETPDDIGIPAVVDDCPPDLVCGYHLALIRPNLAEVDPTFLAKQLGHHATARYFGCRATGSTRFGLANAAVESTPLLLPTLKAQQAIACVVRQADRAIEQTEALIAKYQRIRTGLMQDLLGRGIDEHGRLRDLATHKFKPSQLGGIPESWDVFPIGEFFLVQGGFAFRSEDFVDSGMKLIRISNITQRGLNLTDALCLPPRLLRQAEDYLAREGDVLIAMSGATTGKTSKVTQRDLPAFINQRVGRFVLQDTKQFDADFLYAVVNSPQFLSEVLIDSMGGAQPNVSPSEIEAVKFACPPFAEQEEIAGILRTVSSHLASLEHAKLKLVRLKTGFMQDLLTGSVSVEPLLKTQAAA